MFSFIKYLSEVGILKKSLWRAAFSPRLSTLPRTQRANIIVSWQYDVDWDGNTSRICATHWRRRIRSKCVCSTLSYGHRVPPAVNLHHPTDGITPGLSSTNQPAPMYILYIHVYCMRLSNGNYLRHEGYDLVISRWLFGPRFAHKKFNILEKNHLFLH